MVRFDRQLMKSSRRIEAFKFANQRLGDRLISYAKNKEPGKYFGFDTISSKFLEWGHNKGWEGYLEQCVAPRSTQIAMWQQFEEKYNIDCSNSINFARFQQEVERKEWQYASHIIVPSAYVKDELAKDTHVDISKVHVVNYGYTPQEDKETIKQKIAHRFSKEAGVTNILFAGNAGYRKGIADIITIATDLKSENINFIIAGLLEDEAQKLISQYPHNNVQYVGKLSREKLAEQYSKADMFLFPSYLEGSALVLIEAMSWGLPIVTTYQSGSTVEPGINGFISEAGDVESLKADIIKLLHDKELRYNMSTNALAASSKYSTEKYSENLLKVLKK
jgi:glycosyltransferase involved in cell wall biosynthesis